MNDRACELRSARMIPCKTAGTGSSLRGIEGRPIDRLEREKKTKVWSASRKEQTISEEERERGRREEDDAYTLMPRRGRNRMVS